MPDIEAKPEELVKQVLKAAKSGDSARVKNLVENDPSLLSARDADGSTPLHCAAWKGHLELAGILLDLGAEVNAHNSNAHWGGTPLHAAAHANQRALAELLLDFGADVNAISCNGRTPLAETSFHKATAVARLLKERGARE